MMKKAKPRDQKNTRPDPSEDSVARSTPDRTKPEDAHDAARPGGLPDLDAKTDWEAEHDTWGRHE